MSASDLAALGVLPGASRWIGPCKIGAFDGQQVTLFSGGDIVSGSFTLTLDGETTSAIAFPPTVNGVKSALEALLSVGAGNVDVNVQDNTDLTVVFHDALATELMTADGSGLVGPSSPYTVNVAGAETWPVELFTPAAGDVVEDFLHHIPTAFDSDNGPYLLYTDTPDNPSSGAAWTNPSGGQGVPGDGGIDLSAATTDFTNFTGYGSASVRSQPTSLLILLAAWANTAATTGTDFYNNLPAVVKNSVPVYAYVNHILAPPTAGEVWIWVKVSTPAPMDD
jgi:hypothetical protein